MPIAKPRYSSLHNLLTCELVSDEDPAAATLMHSLRHVRAAKVLTKPELLAICRWKSPRALRLVQANSRDSIRRLTRQALSTRSERRRLECLTRLSGVGIPMASAILTLVNPKRYGVLDIRVWQLLFAIKSVRQRPKGVGFTFKHWYHYLRKLRYHANELGVSVRSVERTLFLCHQRLQRGLLYGALTDGKPRLRGRDTSSRRIDPGEHR